MTVEIVWLGTPQDDGLCHCVGTHRPANWIEEAHHCLPQACGGEPQWINAQGLMVPNLVRLCATGHNSVHEAMKLLYRDANIPPRVINKYCLAVATEGVARIKLEIDRGHITPVQVDSYITHSLARP